MNIKEQMRRTVNAMTIREALEYYVRLNCLFSILENKYGSMEEAKGWLNESNQVFGYEKPVIVATTPEGIERVINYLRV
ncbi:MbcA/ParS/Xre antitoxin family protein [Pontibacterium sinense]